jgi:hypothetical protein
MLVVIVACGCAGWRCAVRAGAKTIRRMGRRRDGWGTRLGVGVIAEEYGSRGRECPPKLTPPAKLAGTPISDDEAVVKMGHPVSVARVYRTDHACGDCSLRLCGVKECGLARGANAHRSSPHQRSWRGPPISDDEAVAKMGHPVRWLGLPALSRLALAFLVIQLPRQDRALAAAAGTTDFGANASYPVGRGELRRLMGGDVGLDESERRWRLGP